MQIRAYLYLMAAAILVPVILFAGFALRLLEGTERDLARAGVMRSAERAALLVDAQHMHTLGALRVLAASQALARGDLAAFHGEAKAAADEHDVWCVLMDERGRLLSNILGPVGATLPDSTIDTYFPSLFAQGRPLVTDVMPGPASGRLVTVVAVPVVSGGRHYALAVSFGTDHFRRLLAKAGLPRDWQVDIVDRQGKLVASNQGPAELVGQDAAPALVAAGVRTREGMLEMQLRNGGNGSVAFGRTPLAGWLIAVGAPASAVAAAPGGARRAAALALVAALVGAAAVSAWFSRGHARSIRVALEAASTLGRGELPPQRRSRIVEIDRLLLALRQAGNELRRAQVTRERAQATSARASSNAPSRRVRWPSRKTAPRTSSWPCSGMNCAIRWRRSAPPPSC